MPSVNLSFSNPNIDIANFSYIYYLEIGVFTIITRSNNHFNIVRNSDNCSSRYVDMKRDNNYDLYINLPQYIRPHGEKLGTVRGPILFPENYADTIYNLILRCENLRIFE